MSFAHRFVTRSSLAGAGALLAVIALTLSAHADHRARTRHASRASVQLGPRPYYLVDDMQPGPLKERLEQCSEGPFRPSDFSIGHRGAAMQFPEHTRESYVAAARMGAGVLECDVTFTSDRELVCRHSQCDLHTTTNILAIPELAEKCSVPFTPADAATGTPANAQCCTSDITLAEFKSLCGKMDASDPNATTVEQYLGGTPPAGPCSATPRASPCSRVWAPSLPPSSRRRA
jgi:glycerophosphoryl diester phosphodiesterase